MFGNALFDVRGVTNVEQVVAFAASLAIKSEITALPEFHLGFGLSSSCQPSDDPD